jgi:hypothetical protein
LYITHISAINGSTTTDTVVRFSAAVDGTYIVYQGFAAKNGGGFSSPFVTPIRCLLNSGLAVRTLSAADVYINVVGYTSRE